MNNQSVKNKTMSKWGKYVWKIDNVALMQYPRELIGNEDESRMSKLKMMNFYVLIYDLTNPMYYLITTPELSVWTDSPVIDTEF